jgi:L-alanine-DL-glutamate epimerase-like enolase superfamily enzyme
MKITKVDTFQIEWGEPGVPRMGTRSAFVRIETEDGQFGLGEASPMQGGLASLVIIANDMASFLIGKDALDHAVLIDTLFHKCIKLGPEGVTTAALAALDIALWDLRASSLANRSTSCSAGPGARA